MDERETVQTGVMPQSSGGRGPADSGWAPLCSLEESVRLVAAAERVPSSLAIAPLPFDSPQAAQEWLASLVPAIAEALCHQLMRAARAAEVVNITREPSRSEFSFNNDRVELSGTCETRQDLRDALREYLKMLEAE